MQADLAPTLFDVAPSGYLEAKARLSDCGLYRYWLRRAWDREAPELTWIGLNPSTADALTDDNTIGKMRGFAERWGFGSILVLNLFAYRATKPADLWVARRRRVNVVGGRETDEQFRYVRGQVVCAWGTNAATAPERVAEVLARLDSSVELVCLGTTKHGHPWHPLYLPWSTPRIPFRPEGDTASQ